MCVCRRGDEGDGEYTTAGCEVYRECVALLRSLRPPPASREGKGSYGEKGVGKTAYWERTERHKTRRGEERKRGEDDREKTRECARGREERGAKIRMSVGMPLGGGVYRVIQRERERERDRSREEGKEKEREEICEDSLFRPGTRPLRTRSGYAPECAYSRTHTRARARYTKSTGKRSILRCDSHLLFSLFFSAARSFALLLFRTPFIPPSPEIDSRIDAIRE